MNPLESMNRMFADQFERAQIRADKIHRAAVMCAEAEELPEDKDADNDDPFTTQDRRAPRPKAAPRERWIVEDRDGDVETLCRSLADAESIRDRNQREASSIGPWRIRHYVEDVQ
jgi:hypothetical protein